ncbi:hypothetical protein ACFVW2_40395, partial [Streptomyces sp. NPDC058171]
MVDKSWSVPRVPLYMAAVVAATIGFTAAPASAETLPWLPVNACGETGFNPAKEPPSPGGPLLPPIPPTVSIPIPYPDFVPVPVPGPRVDQSRVAQDLPADPCADPCPDLTDDVDEPETGPGASGSAGSSGSSGSSALTIPKISIDPRPETIPI